MHATLAGSVPTLTFALIVGAQDFFLAKKSFYSPNYLKEH